MIEIDYAKITLAASDITSLQDFDLIYPKIQSLNAFEVAEALSMISGKLIKSSALMPDIVRIYNPENDFVNIAIQEDRTAFYVYFEGIFEIILKLGVSFSETSIINSSLLEIIDNSFAHNLGQWPYANYKKVIFVMQNHSQQRELNIAISDLGVGFLQTLKSKYNFLDSESAAINYSLRANISSRPKTFFEQKVGGNGLVFLQRNIFNGLNGCLLVCQ